MAKSSIKARRPTGRQDRGKWETFGNRRPTGGRATRGTFGRSPGACTGCLPAGTSPLALRQSSNTSWCARHAIRWTTESPPAGASSSLTAWRTGPRTGRWLRRPRCAADWQNSRSPRTTRGAPGAPRVVAVLTPDPGVRSEETRALVLYLTRPGGRVQGTFAEPDGVLLEAIRHLHETAVPALAQQARDAKRGAPRAAEERDELQ